MQEITKEDPTIRVEDYKITPMLEQYLEIKKEYPQALLFYRMGDFYELFFEDAKVAAKELQIALTSRNNNAPNPIPMCGVPHHSVENYLLQLLDKGYKVAICEQMEDPKQAKGLVKRGVTMVRTPGTSVEEGSLSAKSHNYLGSIYWDAENDVGGFAWLEFSTGEWSGLYSKKKSELWQWVQKLQPRELLVPDFSKSADIVPKSISLGASVPVRLPLRSFFDYNSAQDRILKAQQVQDLASLGLHNKPELVRSCGALLAYAQQMQKKEMTHLGPFRPLDLSQHLILDEITERNLEIFKTLDGKKGLGTLWSIVDETLTPMGGRLLEERLRHPWRDVKLIEEHLEAVEYFVKENKQRQVVRNALEKVYDIERLSTRIYLGRTSPKDFVALRESLASLPLVAKALSAHSREKYTTASEDLDPTLPSLLQKIISSWDSFEDIYSFLAQSIVDSPPPTITEGGLFKLGFNQELDELIDLVSHGEERLQKLLQQEQEKHGLAKLKLGYNKVFGYYFELSRNKDYTIPDYYIRKQTVANAERYITPDLKDLEEKITAAGEKRNIVEHRIFLEMQKHLSSIRSRFLFSASLISQIDVLQSLAEVASKNQWSRPELSNSNQLYIKEGRHPVVERMVGRSSFISNDITFNEQRRLILITGPNMAGKSTVLRQVALITVLAQAGSYVPAKEAHIGVCDRIFSRVGASDNLSQGQSTFMVEMMETARILRQSTKKSLIILDEIGRGTSTFDGLSIAWAVVEDLLKYQSESMRSLFATHYHELTSLSAILPGFFNMNIAIKEHGNDILFLRKLVPGAADKSYGIEVARLAGVPQNVVQRAKKILQELEQNQKQQGKREVNLVMQQLLPGFEAKETHEETQALLAQEEAHPLLVSLEELDVDKITPIQALGMLHEWKNLWGIKKDE